MIISPHFTDKETGEEKLTTVMQLLRGKGGQADNNYIILAYNENSNPNNSNDHLLRAAKSSGTVLLHYKHHIV